MREEGLVAQVTRQTNKRYVEGDNIAIPRDFIERNTDSFRRVIEQHFESFPLCHLGDQRTDMTDSDNSEGRSI